MAASTGISATNTIPFNIANLGAINAVSSLLSPTAGTSLPSLFGNSSTIVQLSSLSQVLSATASFQDQLKALQPGSQTAGGGQNFGSDVTSLAAEAQSFVDAFNNLQTNIANISSVSNTFGGNFNTSALPLALDSQEQANFSNGNSALTNLAQIGINFTPSQGSSGGSLSLDLGTLKSAFKTDATGAFSLLSQASSALSAVAGNTAGGANNPLNAISSLEQLAVTDQLLSSSGLFQGSSSTGFNFADLLALESLNQTNSGNSNAASAQQAILAINEFTLVSSLLG